MSGPRSRIARRSLLHLAGAALLASLGSGCVENEITDDFSTEILITAAGNPGTVYEVRKRFRFSRSPREAAAFALDGARLLLLAPVDRDLTLLHRVDVLMDLGDESEPLLLARAEGFTEGQSWTDMTIVWTDDLLPLLAEDARLTLVFRVQPSAWAQPFPSEGLTVLARASIRITP